MHNVPVNYIDFNGNPQQRVLYFNLSEAEITTQSGNNIVVIGDSKAKSVTATRPPHA